jgi:hypothetical protein
MSKRRSKSLRREKNPREKLSRPDHADGANLPAQTSQIIFNRAEDRRPPATWQKIFLGLAVFLEVVWLALLVYFAAVR